ncbi:cytidine deaminase [bacterium]|nr:cytidine deaminase [bacterium]
MYTEMDRVLIDKARNAREKAISPFSGFKVGAALLCEGGRIYTGCNIENPSLGLGICAERVALVKAISEGEKVFKTLAIVADTQGLTYPCGSCRQMIWEFGPGLQIVLANLKGALKRMAIDDLLPDAFDFNHCMDGFALGGIPNKKGQD